ncbi:MAG: exopolysaccharide biosynthesis protein [Chthoniobacter sp.]|nr:exopolysaccharide biosynthesis protein [Chthoniobacter sp.]
MSAEIEKLAEQAAAVEPRRLSEDLRALLVEAAGRSITVEEIERILRGRGVAILILLFAAPFIVPAPGLSVPFGIAICVLGMRIAIGGRSALPQFVLRKEISFPTLQRIVSPVVRVAEKLEKRIRPRMHFLQDHPRMVNLIGIGIVSGGFILSLPLPVPFSNLLPAVSIMCLAAGLMERDGLLVLWGYVMGLLSWAYLAVCWKIVVSAFHGIWQHFGW